MNPLLGAMSVGMTLCAACVDGGPPDTTEESGFHVMTLNLLHGAFCDDGDHCRIEDRVDLLFQWIEARVSSGIYCAMLWSRRQRARDWAAS